MTGKSVGLLYLPSRLTFISSSSDSEKASVGSNMVDRATDIEPWHVRFAPARCCQGINKAGKAWRRQRGPFSFD
ncbi:unnamed protein product [Gordionus sp. m RMFG-2023]